MAKYLKEFENHSAYEAYMGGGEVILPNVSYCVSENEVHMNPYIPPIHVSSATLNKAALNIGVGDSETLIATVLPNDADNKSVIWSSSNSGVASVDSNGVVSGVSVGNAVITVTTVDGGLTAQCGVVVAVLETRVVAKYNVTSTTEPTILLPPDGYMEINFSEMEIDGVVQPSIETEYTFDTLGEHTVKCTLIDETVIGDDAFYGCSDALVSVVIPNSVTTIGGRAFWGCASLTSVTIPSSVTDMGTNTFGMCTSLTSITIPSGVTEMNYIIYDCDSLTSVICLPTIPPAQDSNEIYCPIYVPSGSVDAYKAAEGWSGYADQIQAIP